MKTRKGLTREIVELKASALSYGEIAEKIGCSRQNIQQLFKPKMAEMIAVADRAKAICEECGQFEQFGHYHHKVYDYDILNEPDNIIYLCTTCHLKLNGRIHYCKHCGAIITPKKTYCSKECRQAHYSVSHECSNCHRQFIMNAHQKIRINKSQSGLIFCTKRCQGLYLAEHHGFGKHPENVHKRHSWGVSKYSNIIPVVTERMARGESLWSILKSMGITRGNYCMIKALINKRAGEIALSSNIGAG